MSLLVEHEGLGESTLEESFLGNAAIEVRRAVTTMVAGTSRMPNYRLTINRHGCVLLWGIPEAMGRGQDIGVSVVQIPHWDVRAPDKQTTPLMRYVLPEESLYYCEQAANMNKEFVLQRLSGVLKGKMGRAAGA